MCNTVMLCNRIKFVVFALSDCAVRTWEVIWPWGNLLMTFSKEHGIWSKG